MYLTKNLEKKGKGILQAQKLCNNARLPARGMASAAGFDLA